MVDIREGRRPRGEGRPPRVRSSVCIKTSEGILRVKKTEAERLVSQGKGTYCSKSEWKAQKNDSTPSS